MNSDSLTPDQQWGIQARMMAVETAAALMPQDGVGVSAEVMLAEAEKIEKWLLREEATENSNG